MIKVRSCFTKTSQKAEASHLWHSKLIRSVFHEYLHHYLIFYFSCDALSLIILAIAAYLSLAFSLLEHLQYWKEFLENGWRFLICRKQPKKKKIVINTKSVCLSMDTYCNEVWLNALHTALNKLPPQFVLFIFVSQVLNQCQNSVCESAMPVGPRLRTQGLIPKSIYERLQ